MHLQLYRLLIQIFMKVLQLARNTPEIYKKHIYNIYQKCVRNQKRKPKKNSNRSHKLSLILTRLIFILF